MNDLNYSRFDFTTKKIKFSNTWFYLNQSNLNSNSTIKTIETTFHSADNSQNFNSTIQFINNSTEILLMAT